MASTYFIDTQRMKDELDFGRIRTQNTKTDEISAKHFACAVLDILHISNPNITKTQEQFNQTAHYTSKPKCLNFTNETFVALV